MGLPIPIGLGLYNSRQECRRANSANRSPKKNQFMATEKKFSRADSSAQPSTIFKRMTIVKASVYARQGDDGDFALFSWEAYKHFCAHTPEFTDLAAL